MLLRVLKSSASLLSPCGIMSQTKCTRKPRMKPRMGFPTWNPITVPMAAWVVTVIWS